MQLMSVETVQLFTSAVLSVLFCRDTFMPSFTPLIHFSVDIVLIIVTPLFSQSFFQSINVVDLVTVDLLLNLVTVDLLLQKSAKSRSPPHSDPGCSVATPVDWWRQEQCLWHGGTEHFTAGRWRIRRKYNTRL